MHNMNAKKKTVMNLEFNNCTFIYVHISHKNNRGDHSYLKHFFSFASPESCIHMKNIR